MPVCVEKAEVCLFQGLTVLGPGQSLVQYLEGELCYTVHCLHHRDPESGFYAMDVSSVNCSQKCGPVWSFSMHASVLFPISIAQLSFRLSLCLCAAPGVRAVHWPSGVLRLLQKHLLHIYRWKQDYRSFCCMGYTFTCPLIHRFLFLCFFSFLSRMITVCFCVQVGSSWVENCTRYDCVETAVGAVVLASGVVCPPFNDTECLQVWTSENDCS